MSSRPAPIVSIALSLVVALALTIVPLPDALDPYRPPWVALVVLHWCVRSPQRFGLTLAWICGLMLDALKGGLLGQHALAMLLAAFIVLKFQLRIRVFPVAQQTLTIAAIIVLYESVLIVIDGFAGKPVGGPARFFSVFGTLFVWPLMSVLPAMAAARREAR